MELIFVIILGLVEGITEFLPISTNGHLLVIESLLHYPATQELRNTFAIALQLGAILAVILYYLPDLIRKLAGIGTDPRARQFWINLIVAFIPIGVIGLLFGKKIQDALFQPWITGLTLTLGGIIFLIVDRGGKDTTSQPDLENITLRQALIVGGAQILSAVPGVSRSGSSIIGGLLGGMNRATAAVFSFYLAIPTLGAAVLYQLFTAIRAHQITSAIAPQLLVGMVVGFGVAMITIRWLLRYIQRHDYRIFGVYRIVVGLLILGLALLAPALLA